MDTMSVIAMGIANRGKELKVFDWHKAATLIKERDVKNAMAGLSGDWEWTGGTILDGGKIPEDNYTYLVSTWATPELEIDGEKIDCYKMESETDGWDSKTFWPESAKAIVGL